MSFSNGRLALGLFYPVYYPGSKQIIDKLRADYGIAPNIAILLLDMIDSMIASLGRAS
jgi:hypothetical protein